MIQKSFSHSVLSNISDTHGCLQNGKKKTPSFLVKLRETKHLNDHFNFLEKAPD